jgi:hypothetical protein
MPAWLHELDIFPNPATDVTTLRGQGYTGQQLSVQVRNAQGALVLPSQNIPVSGGVFVLEIALRTLPSGVYWLELAGESGLLRRKIIRS